MTFGVELEFAILYHSQEVKERKRRLNGTIIRTMDIFSFDIQDQLKHAGILVNDYNPRFPLVENYQRWTLSEDEFKFPELPQDVHYAPMEVISRILPSKQASFAEVRKVVSLIASRYKIKTNFTTGLHIHVGNGDRGFSLRCLRNLMQLVTAFEHEIESLHPDSRTKDSYEDDSWPSYFSAPSQNWSLHPREGPLRSVQIIQQARTLDELIELMHPCGTKFQAYNISGLRPDEKQTIEFRQHIGSMDPDAVVAWAQFTTGLVTFAHNVSTPRLLDLLARQFGEASSLPPPRSEKMDILEFMEEIGVGHLVGFYKQRLYRRPRRRVQDLPATMLLYPGMEEDGSWAEASDEIVRIMQSCG